MCVCARARACVRKARACVRACTCVCERVRAARARVTCVCTCVSVFHLEAAGEGREVGAAPPRVPRHRHPQPAPPALPARAIGELRRRSRATAETLPQLRGEAVEMAGGSALREEAAEILSSERRNAWPAPSQETKKRPENMPCEKRPQKRLAAWRPRRGAAEALDRLGGCGEGLQRSGGAGGTRVAQPRGARKLGERRGGGTLFDWNAVQMTPRSG